MTAKDKVTQKVSKMIDDINSSESIIRLLAAQALRGWTDVAVLKLLRESDFVVRTLAARELHLRGNDFVFNQVLSLTEDDEPYVREIASFVLGQLGTPSYLFKEESILPLSKLLKDNVAEVRAAAAAALGHLCYSKMPSRIENMLLDATRDSSEIVRSCAAYALGNSSGSPVIRNQLIQMIQRDSNEVKSYAELGMEILNNKRNSQLENNEDVIEP